MNVLNSISRKNFKGNLGTYQKGLSLMTVIIVIALIGFSLIYGAKIGIIFIDQSTVKKALKESAVEMNAKESPTVASFKSAVQRRISMNNVTLDANDMTVTRSDKVWTADVIFIKDVPISEKIKLVIDLSFQGEYGK